MTLLRRIFVWLLVLLFFVGLAIGGLFYASFVLITSDATTEVDIPPGTNTRQMGRLLAEHEVIRTPQLFPLIVRALNYDRDLRAGFYEFEAGSTMQQVIDKLRRGDVKWVPLTIIEGWTIADIAAALEKEPSIGSPALAADFQAKARDPAFIIGLGLQGASSLEGYLFADTYHLSRPRNADDILAQLVEQFWLVFDDGMKARAANVGMSVHQAVTLASIIQKEAGNLEEMPLVSSVFHNRLKLKMPLQSDPTVIYGLESFDGNLRKHDLSHPHLYNTYVHPGLPPGPICSVGRAALEVALSPAETKFLYFVSRNNGTHQFSETFAEHTRAVMEFQIRRP